MGVSWIVILGVVVVSESKPIVRLKHYEVQCFPFFKRLCYGRNSVS